MLSISMRVYVDGVFDLWHYGHARLFKQIRDAFPDATIIAGVHNDDTVIRYKGGPLVLTHDERVESARHCKYVDEIIENAPWFITPDFMDLHAIDFVAHDGAPYVAGDVADIYGWLKDAGKFIATQRTDGVSTTDLIARVLGNIDGFQQKQNR